MTFLGLTCNTLQPITGSLWCREQVVLAPCMLKIERGEKGGDEAKFKFAFHGIEEASGSANATCEPEQESQAFWSEAVHVRTLAYAPKLTQWSGLESLLRGA